MADRHHGAALLRPPANAYSLLVECTYVGDANLEGRLSMDDYLLLDASYRCGLNGKGWAAGDFNYDGLADAADCAAPIAGRSPSSKRVAPGVRRVWSANSAAPNRTQKR